MHQTGFKRLIRVLSRTARTPLLAGLLVPVAGLGAEPAPIAAALERLNQARSAAGLAEFTRSPALSRAAQSHADYVARHLPSPTDTAQTFIHRERPGAKGFTGKTPADRAQAAGYPHSRVEENVSLGREDPGAALDGLMTAIYHRLSLLDLGADEVGIGHSGKVHVVLTGSTELTAMCRGERPEAIYHPPALCLQRRVYQETREDLCKALPDQARHRTPYPWTCPDGKTLDGDYMTRLCASPPKSAILTGPGPYYETCGPGTRIRADWWRELCANPPDEALYVGSDHYYTLCDGQTKIDGAWLEKFCEGLPPSADYPYSGDSVEPCHHGPRLHAESLEPLDVAPANRQVRTLLWPPPGAKDVVPAFYDEEPDPLPDREVSGNPLSVQLNPRQVADVQLLDYALWRLGPSGKPARKITLLPLNANSDPHGEFGHLELALFSTEHLGWGVSYLARLRVRIDASTENLSWGFTTRSLGHPLRVVGPDTDRMTFPPSRPFALFIPPTEKEPRPLRSYSYLAPIMTTVQVSAVDYSTAIFTIESPLCQAVDLKLASDRRIIELAPEPCRL